MTNTRAWPDSTFEAYAGIINYATSGMAPAPSYFTTPTDTSGQIIGGVEAYTPERTIELLITPPTQEAQSRRIFGNKAEAQRVKAISRLPGAKTVLKYISKTAQDIGGLAEKAAMELAATSADLGARIGPNTANAIMNLMQSFFVEAGSSDMVTHLGVKENGQATRVRPKAGFVVVSSAKGELAANEVTLDISDVMGHPERYELDEPTMKAIRLWHRINDMTVAFMKQEGIQLDESWMVEGYFPRMVTSVGEYQFARPHVDFTKPRLYATAFEARGEGVQYAIDPIQTIGSYIQEYFLLIASHRLSEGIKQMGETPSQRVPQSVRYAREQAAWDVRRAVRAEQAAQRARRGETIPPSTLASIAKLSPELADAIRGIMAATDKKTAGAAVVLQARDVVAQAKERSAAARAEYKRELAIAQAGTPWSKESGGFYRGHFVSKGVQHLMESWEGNKAHKELAGAASLNDVLRTMVASMDWSSLFIQNLVLLGRPVTFAKVALKSVQVFFDKKAQTQYMAQEWVRGIQQRNPSIRTGFQFEYTAGVSTLGKIPVVGKYIAKAMKPFERFFAFSGDMARIEMARVMEPVFVKAGMPEQVGTFVNRMTGAMSTEALGITSRQRAIERLLLFAPQYTRACLAYIGYVGQNNVMGREALISFGRLYAVGTAMYVASCVALGQEPQLDPTKPTFYTIKVGNRHLGVGGFQYSFLRFMADVAQSLSGKDGNEPLDFTKVSRKDNPILKWLYSRSSPGVGLVAEGFSQRDYLGYPLDSFETWAYWLFVEHMLPIGAQEQFAGPNEEPPSNRLAVGFAEFAGMRSFQTNEFYDLANEYADMEYGKEWNDLWKPTKGGAYVQSPEQKALLANHPDLKEAYDKWKPMQTKKWQADHGLLPNEDAINDAYAREMFSKPWDSLSKAEKNQVKAYREFAEEADELLSEPTTTQATTPRNLPPLTS
jgi:hypothetical protein